MRRTGQDTGKLGERIAGEFLKSRGITILERNFSTPFGEIDLIGRRDGYVIFVEVKTRISERFGPPLSSINETKQKRIVRNCQYYLKRHGLSDGPCRIDVIGIELESSGRLRVLRHVRNAVFM